MASIGSELAGINAALQHQEEIVREYENRLFLEQLRLASLKAAGDRALRLAMLSASPEDAHETPRHRS